MKINQIIRERRKKLLLTQEQVAELLGVSTPAVSKWEKGITYPDITLLPALARLLKIDLNTLMSFNEDLTDIEIEKLVDMIDKTVQEQGYDIAFHVAMDKIHEYPTCETLIYSVVLYLEGALFLYNVSNPEHYRETFEKYFKRLSMNENIEIRDTSISMLISYARNKQNFSEAEELINSLAFSTIDKEEQLAILYQKEEKYEDAERIWEHRVLKSVTDIQTALINMIELSLNKKCEKNADFLADVYEAVTRQFCFPEWMYYNAHLQIALSRKNKSETINLLKKMLPAMKKNWNAQDYQLYQYADSSDYNILLNNLVSAICNDLINDEGYAFLHDDMEFKRLMDKYTDL